MRRTLGGDGHANIRADALVPQVVGQAVGLGMQFGEIEAATVPQQRGALRGQLRLAVQQLRQPFAGRRAGGNAPLGLLLTLAGGQQRQVTDGLLRLPGHLLQQTDEMLGQAGDGRLVEQLVGVVEGQAQTTVAIFLAVQLQVELGFAAVPRQLVGEQAR